MKNSIRTVAALIMVAAILCGTAGCTAAEKKAKAADLMEGVTAQSVPAGRKAVEFSTDVNDFAVRLFRSCEQTAMGGENMLISPISVLLALSMTANGADGETLAQMEEVLGMKTGDLNEFAYSYLNSGSDDPKYFGKLDLANSIWFTSDEEFKVNKDFLQVNADHYSPEIYSAPFDSSTLKDINDWVKKKTDGMIPRILDDIPEDAIMYLINALAFDAEWQTIYKENQVRDSDFTDAAGNTKKVPYMYVTENVYLEDENAVGFIKYYRGKKYAFAALLPNEDLTPAGYIETLTGEHLRDMLSNAERCEVRTSMPKFKTEYSAELSGILESMGMPLPFDKEKADFYKIGTFNTPDYVIYISRVLHKTFIEVDEKGTKAGAATVVEMTKNATALMIEKPQPKEVYLTRPFIYMLIDAEANIPLFIGVMNDPEK